jgi:ABC-type transporter Mla subunit MlaD
MPSRAIAPPLEWLNRLNLALDGASERAGRVRDELAHVSAGAEQAAADHESSMQRIEGTTAQAAAAVSGTLSTARSAAESAAGAIANSSAAVEQHATQAQGAIERMKQATDEALGEQATALDDLLEKLFAVETPYDDTLKSMIEAAKAGITTLDELVRVFGDRAVLIDGKVETLSQAFRRIDWREWEIEFQELVARIRDGEAALSDVEAKLAESQNAIARRLLEMIQLYRQGKITLDGLAAVVRDIQRVFPDTELDELAQAMLQGLLDGAL